MLRRCSALCAMTLLLALAGTASAQQPDAPASPASPTVQLRTRDLSAPRPPQAATINGRPYQRPTQRQLFHDYLRDSYGLPAVARSSVRTVYNQGLDQPGGWGQDGAGLAQRFASNLGITAINGNVRYGMEEIFHEDLRYIPCHGCTAKHRIENALLAEITARHDSDGHRFFTLTPTVADFCGPLVARYAWYPPGGHLNPFYGSFLGFRTVFATRIGSHLFQEFVLERRHHDPSEPIARPPGPPPVAPARSPAP